MTNRAKMKKTIIAYALSAFFISPAFALDLGDVKGVADKLKATTSKTTQQATPVKESAKASGKVEMPAELVGKYATKGNPQACALEESESVLHILKEIVSFGYEGSFTPAKVTGSSGKYSISGSLAFEGEESKETNKFDLSGSNLTVKGKTYVKCGAVNEVKATPAKSVAPVKMPEICRDGNESTKLYLDKNLTKKDKNYYDGSGIWFEPKEELIVKGKKVYKGGIMTNAGIQDLPGTYYVDAAEWVNSCGDFVTK
jgi:hypothetical protein